VNLKSNRQLTKFLYRIVLAGMILSLGFGRGGSTTAHARQAAISSNQVYLPLLMRNFPTNRDQTLTVFWDVSGNGSGTVISSPSGINCASTCSYAFPYNTTVTLTASPTPSSVFAGWSGSGCSGSGTCVVTMNAAKSVTATFNLNYHELVVGISGTGTGGVVSSPEGIVCPGTCIYSFPNNTVVTLTATPNLLSIFEGWSQGACSGTGTCQITMDSNQQALATFNISDLSCIGIGNCDFESGRNVGWTEYSSNNYDIVYDCSDPIFCNDIIPHSGNWLAWLGGEVTEISYIQQQISVTTSAPYLVYWQWIDSSDFCNLDYDYVEVFINGTRVDKYDLCSDTNTTEWVPHNINLTTYAGQSVTLQIRTTTDSNGYSNLYIDDVSLLDVPLALVANPGVTPKHAVTTSYGKGRVGTH
jgi:hypothetical protein